GSPAPLSISAASAANIARPIAIVPSSHPQEASIYPAPARRAIRGIFALLPLGLAGGVRGGPKPFPTGAPAGQARPMPRPNPRPAPVLARRAGSHSRLAQGYTRAPQGHTSPAQGHTLRARVPLFRPKVTESGF